MDTIITPENRAKFTPFYKRHKLHHQFIAEQALIEILEKEEELKKPIQFPSDEGEVDSESLPPQTSDVSTVSDMERYNFFNFMEEFKIKQEKQALELQA